MLAHLETVDCLRATGQPGSMVFLDMAKAFDRIDRAWILRSLEALGAPACIPRWVQVLHGGTCATVAYNGWVTDPFFFFLFFHTLSRSALGFFRAPCLQFCMLLLASRWPHMRAALQHRA